MASLPRMKNILIIGETGVGKSSLINLIVGTNVARTSDLTEGCTFSTSKYNYEDFLLFDTVGFNAAGESNPTQALKNLVKFSEDVKSQGISLIVYVMKKGRANAVSQTNYEYFVKTVCEDKVPVLLVVTHCEQDSAPENWYSYQEEHFKTLGMTFADVVCGCAADITNPKLDHDLIPFLKAKTFRTQLAVRTKIRQVARVEPWKPTDRPGWLVPVFGAAAICLGITSMAWLAIAPQLTMALGGGVIALITKAIRR